MATALTVVMPAAEAKKIRITSAVPPPMPSTSFEPFVQAHNGYTRSHGGTRLGLAISRRLSELMQGTLEVTSREGAGSSFVLRLPAP